MGEVEDTTVGLSMMFIVLVFMGAVAASYKEVKEAMRLFRFTAPPTTEPGDGKVPIFKVDNPGFKYQWFAKGDIDSFFALFFDNLSSLIGILLAFVKLPKIALNCWTPNPVYSCAIRGNNTWTAIDGLDPDGARELGYEFIAAGEFVIAFEDIVFEKICPGIAFALVFGNLWYSWMAFKLAAYENRQDVTALPYGINTPAGFIAAYDVMLPVAFAMRLDSSVYNTSGGSPALYAEKCWKAGCALTFVGGLLEIFGIVLGPFFKRFFAKAGLYAPIAAVGFVWLGYSPLIQVMAEPIVGVLPLALAFTGFFSKGGKGVYGTGAALGIFLSGLIIKWSGGLKWPNLTTGGTGTSPSDMWGTSGDLSPANYGTVTYAAARYAGSNKMEPFACLDGFGDIKNFISVIIPVSIQSFVETIENNEAARVEGDHYNIVESMFVDGFGTMIGACFGSTLPTTVYIGHRRHKLAGARAAYSIMNALAYFILLMSGLFPIIAYFVDATSVGCILIFVGLMIVQQSFEVSAPRHYPALCIGLMFIISDLVFFDLKDQNGLVRTGLNSGRMFGTANMGAGGGIMCSLIVTQIVCDLIDLKFVSCAVFCVIACIFSLFGIMHANNIMDYDGNPTCSLGELCISTRDTNPDPPSWTADYGFPSSGWTRSTVAAQVLTLLPPSQVNWDPIFELDNVAIAGGFMPSDSYDCVDWKFSDDAAGFFDGATEDQASSRNNHGCMASVYHTEAIKTDWGQNEGWRFAVAYAMLFGFCVIHAAIAFLSKNKMCGPPENDGGADPNFKSKCETDKLPTKEVVSATVSAA